MQLRTPGKAWRGLCARWLGWVSSCRPPWGWMLLLGVLGLGLAARLAQYVFNRSLWMDEAYLALNILERDLAGLLQPLSDYQVAPPGFLAVEKVLVSLLGNSEYALRLFPLIGGIAAVFLVHHTARASLGSKSAPPAALAVALVGWSQPLIYFSSELKPYATDALFSLVAYALCLPWLREGVSPAWWRVALAGLAGALIVWLSYPAAFVLASLGVAMVLGPLLRRDARGFFRLAAVPLAWGMGLAALYVVAPTVGAGLSNEFLRTYWTGFFASFPPRSLGEIYWFAQLFFDFLVQACGMPFYGLTTFVWLAGGVALWKSGRWPTVLALVLPLFFAMAAATLHRYPFYGRTLLFAVPPTLLLASKGAQVCYQALAKQSKTIGVLLIASLLFHPAYRTLIVFVEPLTTEESKPVLGYMRAHWQAGDRIYVYHGAAPAFAYYAPRYGFEDERGYRVSRASNGDWAILTEDVQAMRGTRVWFLFTHVYSFGGISEDAFVLDQLNRTWPRLDEFSAPGAAGYLYDMR